VNTTRFILSNTRRIVGAVALTFSVLCLVLLPAAVQAQNIISTFAGGGAPGGAATAVDLPGPSAAIRDAAGNTYIAAPYSTYVFKLSGGTVSPYVGVGYESFCGDSGPAGSACLGLPNGLTLDSKGNLYIADYGNSRIRKVDTSGNITTVAGNGTKCEPNTGVCGDGGLATNAQLNFPMSVAVDGAGNVYIADAFDNRIRCVLAVSGGCGGSKLNVGDITTYAGTGLPCGNPATACGDGGSPTAAQLNFPQGVAFDGAGDLYIADTRDNRIRMIPAGGASISTVAGTGTVCIPTTPCGDGNPATSAYLHMPMAVFVDSSNNIYIADTNDNKVRCVVGVASGCGGSAVGVGKITTLAGNGAQGFTGDGGSAVNAELNFPGDVFLDTAGNLVISDTGNQRIRQVSAGTITTLAGGGSGGDGGPPAGAILENPYNVAVDGSGNIYIADTANNRVRFVNVKTNLITTIAGNGNVGYSGDTGPAASATLNGPTGVALDPSGNLWIADNGNLVIREVNATTQIINTVAGTGKSCFPTNAKCGDGGPATGATFAMPLAIAFDSAGDLFIADDTAHRIREVNAATQIISTVAGTGFEGHKGNGGPATSANLDHPTGIAVDSTGTFYISDSYNNAIRYVKAGVINAYAFNGLTQLGGDGGPALNASMWSPLELALDPGANLFVGGGNDNVVQRVDFASGTVGTVAGTYPSGRGGYAGDGGPAVGSKLSNVGVAVDGQGNLYIADAGNNRVRAVHLTPAATLPTKPVNFGTEPLHVTGSPQTITLNSSGGADLNITQVSLQGNDPSDYAIQTNACTGTIAVDVNCTVTVTFTPLSYSTRTATLVFTDNAPNTPQSVTLTGSGPDFTITASPTSLTIQPGSSGSSTLTIAPVGGFNQTINLSCNGAPPNSTCSLSQNSVILDGTNSQNVTLTLQTTSSTPVGKYTLTGEGTFGPVHHLANIKVNIP
jgi:sugar lactone lactonase YvrE